jgi:hypothetical protein
MLSPYDPGGSMKPCMILPALALVVCTARGGDAGLRSSSEAFPLRKGIQAVYSYQWQNLSIDVMWGGTLTTDSGTVAYRVIDSAWASDTSQVWNVEETEHLLHRHYAERLYTPPSLDSAYWVDSSRTFSLVEDLTGLHRLHGSSLVWSFPVRDTLMNIGYGRGDTTVDFYRFGTSASQIVVALWNGNSWINDTLALKPGQGLASRAFVKGDASNVRNNYNLNIALLTTTAGVKQLPAAVPATFVLEQNYPNPFNPSTTIRYSLPARSHVSLDLFNMLGQNVATLVREVENAGRHEVRFDGTGLASGTYVYRLIAGGVAASRRLLILK